MKINTKLVVDVLSPVVNTDTVNNADQSGDI